MIKRIRKGSLTYFLLLALEKAVEAGISVADFYDSPHRFAWTGYRTNLNYSNLYRSIRQLREKGYIETPKDGRKILLKLTDKGKQEIILKKLMEDKKWDGKWRLVIFDIPEKHRRERHVLRDQLRTWQFEPWQKSVWASRKDVAEPLKEFVKKVGISDWVKVLVASDLK